MKKLLLVSTMMLATSAMASEITNPFYLPTEGSLFSTTSADFTKIRVKQGDNKAKAYTQNVNEVVQYGIADNWSVDVEIGNTWQRAKYGFEDNTNFDFKLGTTYNIYKTGPLNVQTNVAYGQKESVESLGAYKYVGAGIKAGYQSGIYTPYVQGDVEIPVYQHKDGQNGMTYNAKAGLYAYCPRMNMSIDTGVSAGYEETSETRSYAYDLEAAYFAKENIALSLYGTFGKDYAKEDIDFINQTIGMRVRVQF